MPGHQATPRFARGGRLTRYVGQPVSLAEDGPEAVVGDDGQVQVINQPSIAIPQEPATVLNSAQTRAVMNNVPLANPQSGVKRAITVKRRIRD